MKKQYGDLAALVFSSAALILELLGIAGRLNRVLFPVLLLTAISFFFLVSQSSLSFRKKAGCRLMNILDHQHYYAVCPACLSVIRTSARNKKRLIRCPRCGAKMKA